jgi:hypothetical protein
MGRVSESEFVRETNEGSVDSKGSHVARCLTYFHFLIAKS